MALPVIKVVHPRVTKFLGLHPDTDFNTVSKAAGRKLREMGYVNKYHHGAWNRGRKWFAPNSSVPHHQESPVHILSEHLAQSQHAEELPYGHISEDRAKEIINDKYGN